MPCVFRQEVDAIRQRNETSTDRHAGADVRVRVVQLVQSVE